ncbi:hypothetical protein KAM398_12570 [Acinetobacter sp. KAM398]|uniref:hypothetical protein n=1 Tax=Acinetobacter TaxID=469 RepID=UPI001F1BD41E|nr:MULTISPECIES: hypothetical protein [Acinetobacter]GJC31062.1 hypothetical protein KAM392_10410 [Acinetobacter sp. KAM392]GJC33933.1 hypothetical protein KAM393_11020 [Acinetobacter sp. KAM393]GJC39519.1 hypothetical protein KAM395_10400 [Acinetobacter sp. KAM395]GJC42501.1 hypothetical protein KAM396_11980 [Acinetobacter sp. KAM396]GJC53835.1 hypothetical protein KAM400_12460 [Acinetobacter sp. KAM400]GJC56453.1 hypothetical protein KAM401_10400 [Acinetobacter sp. KAM401]GJC59268.1 hypoth
MLNGFVAQRFHNYVILKVLIVFFDPKLNLFKSDAYIFMQQTPYHVGLRCTFEQVAAHCVSV